jgi:hypothetical protein
MTQPLGSSDDFRESGWSGSRVVYEHHYDLRRTGDPLTFDDLAFLELGIAMIHHAFLQYSRRLGLFSNGQGNTNTFNAYRKMTVR